MSSPLVPVELVPEVLFVGPESAGKSLVVKNLVRLFAETKHEINNGIDLDAFCAQTVGVDIVDLVIDEKKCQFRELGSAIVSRWHSYYEACTVLVFVIDLSDISNWSAAFLALLEASQYQHTMLEGKPVLVLLNRVEDIDKMTYQAGLQSLQLSYLKVSWPKLATLEASPSQSESLEVIARWIKSHLPR